ncbi:MAG: ABC transporter permease, partial [Candidatus Omnitrophica bacterium]|nr:ABC transporter permease [Candidatus Omnitrophota bacterium]
LRSSFPPEIGTVKIYFLIIIILSFIGWASLARVIRGLVLGLREKDFILAARSIGLSNFKIIIRHILPNTSSYTLVAMALSIPSYILGESALSLLGLGIQDPVPSWGNLLKDAMSIVQIKFYPWILIPGFFIFLTVAAFNMLGDALRDIYDPKKVTQL